MKDNTRTQKSLKNTIFGYSSQIIILLFSFITRTFFIHTLGAEYLGVNGLFTNILSMLSLAELGLGNVLIFSLYKPLHANDTNRISALINYSKKLYRIIAVVILVIGLSVVPFLGYIVNSTLNLNEIRLYYVLFLLNSVATYFVVHKSTLIQADQKLYKTTVISTSSIILQYTLQISILLIWGNYILFLLAQIFSTIFNNIFLNITADKMYPYLKEKSTEIDEKEKRSIKSNLKAMFSYKIGVVVMNYTDNILISVILGTIVVGYYSNYSLLIMMIGTFISILIRGISSSVGNLMHSTSGDSSYNIYNILIFIFQLIGAIVSIALIINVNPFIIFWIGEEYLLDTNVLYIIVLSFYLACVANQNWIYREVAGLFEEMKYVLLIAAGINLFLSIMLGFKIGLGGILLATVIARLLTFFWYEPKILYKKLFNKNVGEYWYRQGKYLLISIFSLIICIQITNRINLENPLLDMIINVIIVFVVTSTSFVVINIKTIEVKYLLSKISKLLIKLKIIK